MTTRGVILVRNRPRLRRRCPTSTIPRGRSVAILGASGSGKTTALMALAGIRAPASGEIVVADAALWRLPAAQRDLFRGRRIGLVFQSFHLIDAVSVAANLALAARCAGLPPDSGRMDQLLETLQIAELRRTTGRPHQSRSGAARGHRARAFQQARRRVRRRADIGPRRCIHRPACWRC